MGLTIGLRSLVTIGKESKLFTHVGLFLSEDFAQSLALT